MEEEIKARKRKVTIRNSKFLENLAGISPELAEELAVSDKPLEQVIAEEVSFARLIKHKAVAEMDVETLLATFDIWNKIMERALQYFTNANMMFMMNFLNQYEYLQNTMMQKASQERMPHPKELIAMKMLELFDDLKHNLLGFKLTRKEEEEEEEESEDEEPEEEEEVEESKEEGKEYTLVI